ncbi:MAG TPA: CmpA/NrtA family ABC transporter substrate-binding protein [Herpetosiphonaceae bacterium]
MTDKHTTPISRRGFLRAAAGAAGALALGGCGGGSDAGDRPIRIGFIPLTDCASVVMADKLGLYAKHGLKVEVVKEASWANVRDKLLTGDLDAAHCLFGMPFSVHAGIGGRAGSELKIAMVLNSNGQGLTLRSELADALGYGEPARLKAAVDALKASKTPTFAATFPGGTHDIWLRYWLAAGGVGQDEVKLITIPPPQMVANMRVGEMDGFCVGEPWNGVAVKEGIGATVLASQDLWDGHPEKALVANPQFAERRRADLKKLMLAIIEASQWLDDLDHRAEAAAVLSGPAYVNAPAEALAGRLLGQYELGAGLGSRSFDAGRAMLFHRGGQVNAPQRSHAIWFMAQYVRFGLLAAAPDYAAVAERLILRDLYAEVAGELGLAVPDDMQPFAVTLDQRQFDPRNPAVALAGAR